MKERYLKVLGLFSISTLIPTLLINSKCLNNGVIKYILRTALGYGIFASGLRYFSKLKSTLISWQEQDMEKSPYFALFNLLYSKCISLYII